VLQWSFPAKTLNYVPGKKEYMTIKDAKSFLKIFKDIEKDIKG
jgi:hypothetical protein